MGIINCNDKIHDNSGFNLLSKVLKHDILGTVPHPSKRQSMWPGAAN